MLRYLHERTKDLSGRFLLSLERPNPFRTWRKAPSKSLPIVEDPDLSCRNLFHPTSPSWEFSLEGISKFLELGAGITGIYGGNLRRSVRANPSAGNLHPEEIYLLLPEEGLFHYRVEDHTLELRAEFPKKLKENLRSLLPDGGFIVILTAIYWRTVWKYGIRGFRYALLDIGHLYASLKFAAHLLGWEVLPLWNISPKTMDEILGFDGSTFPTGENEYPQLMLYVLPPDSHYVSPIPANILSMFNELKFLGRPNRLSESAVELPEVTALERETQKGYYDEQPMEKTVKTSPKFGENLKAIPEKCRAADILRRRRSPFFFKNNNHLGADTVSNLVWLAHDYREEGITFKVFLQRVSGYRDGSYDAYLNLLKAGRIDRFVTRLTCNQQHCGNANINFVIVSELTLAYEIPKLYRTLHYRAGATAQIIYILAEIYGLRGNAIGCFNDDLLNIHGITDLTYLHHIALGEGNTPSNWMATPFRYGRRS
ncbi:MAG: SagB/ThcOx family dehydrogenase [Thermotogae bacterium]|nr:SagB/ThcOx family dehydrogenase [Thermotogota bacterium]